MSEPNIILVGKVTWRKCKREVVGYLAGPPDFKMTDDFREKIEVRWRAYHEGGCKGT